MDNLTDRHMAILTGILVSVLDDARRDGRTGDWVDMVREIFDAVESVPTARSKTAPTGGEPFGTKVTFWSANWGTRHAVITRSPKPADERDRFDSCEWAIHIKGGGMTYVPADQLTLGWHPEAGQ